MKTSSVLALGLALALALGGGTAAAHDTWLEARPAPPGRIALALTSGTLFPAGETPIAAASLVEQGCIDAAGARVPLLPAPPSPASASALVLQANAADGAAVQSCWAQTTHFEIELAERLVPVYLREIAAPERVRARWLADRRQGLPWHERYAKHARISMSIAPAPMPAAHAAPMAMDIELSSAQVPLRAGAVIEFRVLRDGAPLAGQAVELRGDMSRFGLWRRTDSEGRASVPVPFAGRWVLRATDLRPVPGRPGEWDSRFATHTFTVEGAAADAAANRGAQPNGGSDRGVQANQPVS